MRRDIPGYYYDETKGRYFRIEKGQTAPADAAWSARNVRRRAEEEREEAAVREQLRRAALRVKRAPVWRAPLLGGMLSREAGTETRGTETPVEAWTKGLSHKGHWRPWSNTFERPNENSIWTMWVGPSGGLSDVGVAYAACEVWGLSASYLPKDGQDCINFRYAAQRYPFMPQTTRRYLPGGSILALKYHAPSGKMIAPWKPAGRGMRIKLFTPRSSSQDESGPVWTIENEELSPRAANWGLKADHMFTFVNACQTAPNWSSRLTCVFGTNHGLAVLQNDKLDWIDPPVQNILDWSLVDNPPKRDRYWDKDGNKRLKRDNEKRDNDNRKRANDNGNRDDVKLQPWYFETLAVDFLAQNPAEVILAGTRGGHVCVLDLRSPPDSWTRRANTFRHPKSVAHIRSVGDYGVLAAGPYSKMCIYDIRYLARTRPQLDTSVSNDWTWNVRATTEATRPLVIFHEYRNMPFIQIGLDVLTEGGYGKGLVAAAHDDGTVGVYSLQNGKRLAAGAVDGIHEPCVVKSLMWSAFPGDRHPSLFVGEGGCVRKYSFGGRDNDEWMVSEEHDA